MKGKEAITKENFDADEYADSLREQGYKDSVIPDLVAKKKESLNKLENDSESFEYVVKLEEVEKSEDDLIIAGFASTGKVDWDDEAIDKTSLQEAWADYMLNPVIRYMHGKDNRHPDAIGRVIPSYTKANGETIKTEFINNRPFIVAKLSNAFDVSDIKTKIKERVISGLSIGGKAKRVSEFCPGLGKNINKIHVNRLSEISVVDLPANKESFFSVIKGCVGNNCEINIEPEKLDNNYEEAVKIVSEDEKQITKGVEKMGETIEMEMVELKEFIKSTVSEMITEQETVEKVEAGAAAVVEIQDLRARIAELEAKVAAQAAQLKASPQEAMKSEEVVEEIVVKADTELDMLKTEIAELKASPLYKAKQTDVVEKAETVEQVSLIGDILKAHYGGN